MPLDSTERLALEAQVKALKDLIEVAKAVVSTLDLDTMLQAILESAMKFADTPAGSIALYDDQKNELTIHAHSGLTTDFVKTERWAVQPGGLTEHVLASKAIKYIGDTSSTEFFRNPIALNEGIRSLICIPLVLHEKILGILYLDDFVTRDFDTERMELLAVVGSFAAMAIDNATLHKKTSLMAITDSLTGLFNFRYFHQVFKKELDRAKRYHKPLSVIMLDVDDFKNFNDRYGHPRGDRVLENVGRIIMASLRSVDSAFRYGGEEFIILLPETKINNGLHVAERLRENIEREAVAGLDVPGVTITASIGLATFPKDGSSPSQILDCVDQLLYDAKARGKNKVYFKE